MRTIWKYEIPMAHAFAPIMPSGAHVLTVQIQGQVPYLWAEVESDAPMSTRQFLIAGTGRSLPTSYDRQYIGTWQQDGYVWHLYEDLPQPPDFGPR